MIRLAMSTEKQKFVKSFIRDCLLFQVLFFAWPCLADELEPKRWNHLPIDTNFVGTGYAYTDADIALDPVLKIEDGQMEMHTWAAKYIRTFALFEKTARIEFLQAYQEGRWSGLLDGVPTTVNRSGWSDTVYDSRLTCTAHRRCRAKNMLHTGQSNRLRPSSERDCPYSCRPVTTWTTN